MQSAHPSFSNHFVARQVHTSPAGIEDVRRAAGVARLCSNASDALVSALQVLPDVLGKRMVIYEPRARDLSFDEAWLLNTFDAIRQGDTDRYSFAMLSRMDRVKATELHFLMCKAAWTLDASS